MREVIHFRDAVALLVCLLPIRCPLVICVAAYVPGRKVAHTRWLSLYGIVWGRESVVGSAAGQCSDVCEAGGGGGAWEVILHLHNF